MAKSRLNDCIHLRTENIKLMDELKMRQLTIYGELDRVERYIKEGINIRKSLMKKQVLRSEIDTITEELISMRADQRTYEEIVYSQQKEVNEYEEHLQDLDQKTQQGRLKSKSVNFKHFELYLVTIELKTN